jgi:hypothetical protein
MPLGGMLADYPLSQDIGCDLILPPNRPSPHFSFLHQRRHKLNVSSRDRSSPHSFPPSCSEISSTVVLEYHHHHQDHRRTNTFTTYISSFITTSAQRSFCNNNRLVLDLQTTYTVATMDPAKIANVIPAKIIMLSGSEDKQTSADAFDL